ncbi:MFS transporter [Paenibacillus sp. UMB4589-SE434]|uniref:MFS transporter n=1 Tax=Paenibacillus sp. UMB4589-SE434 TaxID=3046314 RepID=UPI00254AA698|nr:MFS transporter [Paenibacillus sp. UMB4589-SE434]MDK8180549.1 MFS transporter [Paenibacillus sp. UMB4589-SE434]
MKSRFMIMFCIVLGAMISIAAFNPIIGPLSRNLGLSEFQSGCLVAISGLCWLLGGYYWERKRFMPRKAMLIMVMVVYLLTLLGFGWLADHATAITSSTTGLFWIFFVLRTVAGFFYGGIPSLSQAYIMGWTTADTRTKGMALFGAANGLGFVMGPALSGAMAPISLTAPMYTAAIFLLLMAILFGIWIPNMPYQETRTRTASLSPNDSRIRLYLGIGLILSVALNIVQVTIGFYIQDQLHYDASATMQLIGTGLALSGVMVVVSQVVISKFLRWSTTGQLYLGLSCVGIGLLGFVLFVDYAYVAFIILGVGIGFTMLGYSAGASLAVQDHEQGSVASYIASLQGGGAFVGPLLGTMLYTTYIKLPYVLGITLMGLSLLFVWRKRQVRQTAM